MKFAIKGYFIQCQSELYSACLIDAENCTEAVKYYMKRTGGDERRFRKIEIEPLDLTLYDAD